MRRGYWGVAGVVLLGALAVGCGSTTHHDAAAPASTAAATTTAPPTTLPATTTTTTVPEPKGCLPGIQHLLAQREHGRVSLSSQTRVTDIVVCRFAVAHPAQPGCTASSVMVNTDPQPYTDFNRWDVEAGQNVYQNGHPNMALAPHVVFGIGEGADWVPGKHLIEAVNTTRWVSVQLHCPSTSKPFALAKALVVATLVDPVGSG